MWPARGSRFWYLSVKIGVYLVIGSMGCIYIEEEERTESGTCGNMNPETFSIVMVQTLSRLCCSKSRRSEGPIYNRSILVPQFHGIRRRCLVFDIHAQAADDDDKKNTKSRI